MSLLHQNEHLSCLNYDRGEKMAVSLRSIAAGDSLCEEGALCKIVFVLKGEVYYSARLLKSYLLRQGQIVFILPDCTFSFDAAGDAELLVLRLSREIRFCECYQLETLMNQTFRKKNCILPMTSSEPPLLEMNTELEGYVSLLCMCIDKGLKCRYYMDMKIRELFYLFRAFYPKEQLAMFFRDAVGYDSYFSHYILNNHQRYSSVSALAVAMNTSLSAFEKRFKKVFGKAPYRWMTEQKAKQIFYALNTEDTPLKELSLRFGFANKSTFSDFCKKNLRQTPAAIRKQNMHANCVDIKNKSAEMRNYK